MDKRYIALSKAHEKTMNKSNWKKKIKQACKDAGTYRPYFDTVIETLAAILENRDIAVEQFEDSGGNAVVKHTNKGGNTNIVKNPALVVVDDLNRTALTYWRELGLTPKGLKAINEKAISSGKKKNTLGDALRELGI